MTLWLKNSQNGRSPCRVNQASTVVDEQIYLFGGYCHELTKFELSYRYPIDVHVFNSQTLAWTKRPVPTKDDPQFNFTPFFRYGHTCVTYKDRIYLWGGRSHWSHSLDTNLYVYYPKKHIWNIVETKGTSPYGRDGHSACIYKNQMLIFGGYVEILKKFSNEIYSFDFLTSTWTNIVPKSDLRPYWRDFHTASIIKNQMYIFGGRMDQGQEEFTNRSIYSNDLYAFNLITEKWAQIISTSSLPESSESGKVSPSGRRSHSAIVYKDKIIIFGGFRQSDNPTHFNDLYEFDSVKQEWKMIKPAGKTPCPRRRHSCCLIGSKLFISGGTGPSSLCDNLIEPQRNVPNSNERTLISAQDISPILENNQEYIIDNQNTDTINSYANNTISNNQQSSGASYSTNNNNNLISNNNMNRNALFEIETSDDDQAEISDFDTDNDEQIDFDFGTEEDDDANDESETDSLVSFSDLHVLELEVPSLRDLCIYIIIKNKINCNELPKNLMLEVERWKK